jgi:UDPglucose 6-dehydrogenase
VKISVIGCGYVGIVSGAGLAEKGHTVVCVDADPGKVAKVNAGVPPFYEPGLKELLARHVPDRMRATGDLAAAVLESDLTLVAVGTPFDGRNIDLSYIEGACSEIGEALRRKPSYHTVVIKSTVVPGTTGGVVRRVLEAHSGKQCGVGFGLGMNPEFLTEGQAVADFLEPDRIVIGGVDARSTEMMEELYRDFDGVEVQRVNVGTAEMIKYASNALLATMISFSNEFANLCSAMDDIDVVDVMRGVHHSRYLSARDEKNGTYVEAPITSFLAAGCGFGGSCLPKDVKALIARGEESGVPMCLLTSVMHINERQPGRVVGMLKRRFPSLKGVRVTVLGLAFKPDTSDIRETPAIPMMRELLAAGASVKAHDPVANEEVKAILPEVEYCNELPRAIEASQAVIVVTRWQQYLELPRLLRNADPQPLVLDARRMLKRSDLAHYAGVGLGDSVRSHPGQNSGSQV